MEGHITGRLMTVPEESGGIRDKGTKGFGRLARRMIGDQRWYIEILIHLFCVTNL